MKPVYDYGYKFDFPNGYDPGDCEDPEQFYFDAELFEQYITILENCVYHCKGELLGQPLKPEKWQRDIVAALFCLKRKDNKQRRYSEALIYVPRKNGKSMLCSGLIIPYLILDDEKGKEIVSVAGSSDQASLIYKPIRYSLKHPDSPLNSADNTNPNCIFKVLANPKKIVSENELNTYMPLTADGELQHGLNVSLSVMDEMHSWKDKKGRSIYEAVVTSGGARQSPLNIIITTADFMRDSLCNAKFEKAKRVCNNEDDDETFLPVLYYLDETDDWTDEENWKRVNPQYGKSISPDFLRKEFKKAQTDPTYTNSFKRLYLNMQTKAETKFLDFAKWITLEDKEFNAAGKYAFGGLDMAYKSDLCAFVLAFPLPDKMHIKSWFWIPEGHKDLQYYADKGFIDANNITVTKGNGIDFNKVKSDIVEICKNYTMVQIGYDPRFATELCQSLYNEYGLPMIEVPQFPRNLSEALKDMAIGITDARFSHDGNRCANWQVGNASAKELGDGIIKLVKPTGNDSTLLKVDFVAAWSMAQTLFLKDEDKEMYAQGSSGNRKSWF